MRPPRMKRKGTAFGSGTYAQRHGQGYQAVTGAVVMSLAVATLALHHFGFGLALSLALGVAIICAVARTRAVVSAYVVGLSLMAGVLMTPMGGTPGTLFPLSASGNAVSPVSPGPVEYELYVLEGPALDRSYLRPAPSPLNTGQQKPDRSEHNNWSAQLPSPHTRRIFEL